MKIWSVTMGNTKSLYNCRRFNDERTIVNRDDFVTGLVASSAYNQS